MFEQWRKVLFSNKRESNVAKKFPQDLPSNVVNIGQEISAGDKSDVDRNKQSQHVTVNNYINSPPNVSENPTVQTQALPAIKIPATITKGKNDLVLYVIPNGESEWILYGTSTNQSVEQIVKAPLHPLNLWEYGKNCLGKVLKWLRETIAYFQNQCNLAIVDLTSQQIPWEMVRLQSSEVIGVKVKVVRWLEQEAWGESVMLDLMQPKNYQGRLVTYKHPRNDSCADLDNCLKNWRKDLSNHVQQPVSIGLLHCHEQLSKVSFEAIACVLNQRSLFLFINSPYSALAILIMTFGLPNRVRP